MFQIKVSLCIKPNATPLLVMNDVIESGFRFAITHSSRFARESVVESHYWVLTIHWTQSDKTQITWCIIWAVVAIKPLNSVYNTTPRATLASLLTHFCARARAHTYIYIYIYIYSAYNYNWECRIRVCEHAWRWGNHVGCSSC